MHGIENSLAQSMSLMNKPLVLGFSLRAWNMSIVLMRTQGLSAASCLTWGWTKSQKSCGVILIWGASLSTCLSCFASLELEKLLDALDCSRVLFFDDTGAPILIAAKSPAASPKPALLKPKGAAVCFSLKFKFGFYFKLGFSNSIVLLADVGAPFLAWGQANLKSPISFFLLKTFSISSSKSDSLPSDSSLVFEGFAT